jgi:predicted hotdog family 3-hydroxylacyl-ACP dehydratase
MQPADVDILSLLPQRPPFVMVDRLLDYTPSATKTSLLVRPGNIFCDNGRLSESGVVENMAQTCAARMGYINRELEGDSVKLGFIGSVRNLEIFRLPETGEEVVTEITVLEEVFRMTLVSVVTTGTKGPVASGEMKIALTDIAKQADE